MTSRSRPPLADTRSMGPLPVKALRRAVALATQAVLQLVSEQHERFTPRVVGRTLHESREIHAFYPKRTSAMAPF